MAAFGDLNRINTNVASLDARLSLNRINKSLFQNQQRLSTGLRINRAEDDVVGYSIASKMNGRIAGLSQALENVGDAKSVLDIAESGFDTVMDQLIEMKTLSTRAANATLGAAERADIGKQIESLANDINDIANQTVFQDISLLNGTGQTQSQPREEELTLTFQVGERSTDILTAKLSAVNVTSLFSSDGTNQSSNLGATTGGGATAGAAITVSAMTASTQGGVLSFTEDANAADFRKFVDSVDIAIQRMTERVTEVGTIQRSLSTREVTLSQSISANSSAVSRIMDTDFAKEQSESIRLQILQQIAVSGMSQANLGPQTVLSFLR
jgi:flagellin